MRSHPPTRNASRALPRVIIIAVVLGCEPRTVEPPTAPAAPAAPATAATRVGCIADVRAQKIACAPGAPPATASTDSKGITPGGVSRDLILGGQNTLVKLASSGVSYSGGVFSFSTTVTNLIDQSLGTTDGLTTDLNGVRVFFESRHKH